MPESDAWLFDPDDPRSPPPNRSLVIRSAHGRPLSKEERAFNRALAKVQALGRALDEETRRLDRLLVFHATEIRPRFERVTELHAALVRALVPFLDDRRLTKGQRRVVRDILVEQLDTALSRVEKPDPDFQALFERLHDISYAQALSDDIEDARADMAAMFDELGVAIAVPEIRPNMSEEDLAAAAARFAHELRCAEENAPEPARHKTRRELRAEERARRHEQLRKDTLGVVYRRLVKGLHPDLETDPAERERKGRIMQEVTVAYGRRDLHELLRLELEWLEGAGDAVRMSQEKLRTYTELLKQQALELHTEIESLGLHPRYAPLLVDGPFGLRMILDGPTEVERLDLEVEKIRFALERLTSGEALEEVRGAIREYREAEKRRARQGRWR